MKIISLLTDFGLQDGYVGVMKGVIYGIAPQVRLVDLSHEIPPQNVAAAALMLERCCSYFPPGSIHVAVVDPGVGTERRPIAARLGEQWFVGPDNGVFSLVLTRTEALGQSVEIVHTNKPQFWLPEISRTFHGRDIFSPVAAHLATGVSLSEIGTAINDPVRLAIPEPVRAPHGWKSEISHIDHFGNIATRLRTEHLPERSQARIVLKDVEIRAFVDAFGEQTSGSLVALINSAGFLEISAVNGNAAAILDAHYGDLVELRFD